MNSARASLTVKPTLNDQKLPRLTTHPKTWYNDLISCKEGIFILAGYKRLIKMTNDEIVKKWLSAFASNVPKDVIENQVIISGNYMWHILGWGNNPCLIGDGARNVFDELSFDEAIIITRGYSVKNWPHIEDVKICGKISSAAIDKINDDIYVVDKCFHWTYVRTHEDDCGPYLAYRIV